MCMLIVISTSEEFIPVLLRVLLLEIIQSIFMCIKIVIVFNLESQTYNTNAVWSPV